MIVQHPIDQQRKHQAFCQDVMQRFTLGDEIAAIAQFHGCSRVRVEAAIRECIGQLAAMVQAAEQAKTETAH